MSTDKPQWWLDRERNPPAAQTTKSGDIDLDKTLKVQEDFRKGQEAALEREKLKAGGAALPRLARPDDIVLEIAMTGDKTAKLHYLVEPWLPHNQVIGFYGRGETAKSSFVATMAAAVSDTASTFWVSTEEPIDWIKVRHLKAGGEDGTLFVYKAHVTKTDQAGRALASMFNVYEHLEPAIEQVQKQVEAVADGMGMLARPLRLVVLDTAVALTTWGRSESPNSDAAVKRLMAYLLALCEKYDVAIAVIGHSNKGKHDNLSDTVAGSAAWVNSLRQAFIHVHDNRGEYEYVTCTVKSTLTGTFAAPYSTYPVHELATRADGNKSVLCAVRVSTVRWGYANAMDLVDEATERESDSVMVTRKKSSVAQIVATVLDLLAIGAEPVTRQSVNVVIGHEPSRRHWQEADNVLMLAHKVTISPGERGRLVYQMQ